MKKDKEKKTLGISVQMFCGQHHGNCYWCEKKEGKFKPIILNLGYGFVMGTDTSHIFCSLDHAFKYINSWRKNIEEDFNRMLKTTKTNKGE